MIDIKDLSPLQKDAFNRCIDFRGKVLRICGYAGTGKTTVLAALSQHLGLRCQVMAPTNKAAQVLRDKGVKSATIHSILYVPTEVPIYAEDEDGNIIYEGEDKDRKPKVIRYEVIFDLNMDPDDNHLPPIAIVDESSMVDEKVYDDLCSCFETVIFFGDLFQLPPVKSNKSALDLGKPDVEMKEVHRVAMGNPITKYATFIRNGKEPPLRGVYKELQPRDWNDPKLYEDIVEGKYQAICYTNRMRHIINENIRNVLGYEKGTLRAGEPIISLDNIRIHVPRSKFTGNRLDEDLIRAMVMFNGQVTTQPADWGDVDWILNKQLMRIDGIDKDIWNSPISVFPFWMTDYEELLTKYKNENPAKKLKGFNFNFAYCLTAHKSQGSEFDNVAVFDERPIMRHSSHYEKMRWYYTAITRAKQNLMVIRR